MTGEIRNVVEYEAALKYFDWWYDMSDSYSVNRAGRAREDQLKLARSKFDPDQTLWNKYNPR